MLAIEGIKLKSKNKDVKSSKTITKKTSKKTTKYDKMLTSLSKKVNKLREQYLINHISNQVITKWLKQYYKQITQYYEDKNIYVVRFYLEIRYLMYKFIGPLDVNFNVLANRELYENISNVNFGSKLRWFDPNKSLLYYTTRYSRSSYLYLNIIPFMDDDNFNDLILSNIHLASKTLIKRGHMILRVSNIFTPKNYSILSMLSSMFKEVHIIKPQADPLSNTNTDYYIVATKFKGEVKCDMKLKTIKKHYTIEKSYVKSLCKLYKDLYKNYKNILSLILLNRAPSNMNNLLFNNLNNYLRFYKTYIGDIFYR